jgi:FkbM family methyltransferase
MIEKSIRFTTSKVDGFDLIVLSSKDIQQSYWVNNKWYERGMLYFIKKNYKGGTFVDIGSCIGNHSIFFSTIADKVYSFEPITINYLIQQGNIMTNGIKNIECFNLAISNENKIVKMNADHFINAVGGGTIVDEGKIEVCAYKLDNLNLNDIKIIKIDVQGHEKQVIEGAEQTIKRNLPDLFIETETYIEYENRLAQLKAIDERYNSYKTVFNNSPTILFTIKDLSTFIPLENENNFVVDTDIRKNFIKGVKCQQ